MKKQHSIAFHTLGCKLNFSETSSIVRQVEKEGYVRKNFDEKADIYVINTCSVTENADKECRYLVRRIQSKSPESFIVITGCYAQLKPEEISNIPGVDLVLGAAEKFNIVNHLTDLTKVDKGRIYSCEIESITGFNSSYSANDRTRTFLKVQDGCDYSCSFCTIPLARGKSRSDSIENVISNVQNIVATSDTKEIVLTGVNLGDFGKGAGGTNKNSKQFLELLIQLDKVQGIERFRISSIEPNLLSDEIIEFVSNSSKVMPHFHIPLQSGSNRILASMKRRYKRELYYDKVQLIKKLIPNCCIGVDVIVGFPGETDECFNETFTYLHQLDVSYLHVFTYSERENTLANDFESIVPMNIRNERNKILRNLSFKKLKFFTESQAGQTRKVLFEKFQKDGMMEGYTDNYLRIVTPYRKEWANEIIDWVL